MAEDSIPELSPEDASKARKRAANIAWRAAHPNYFSDWRIRNKARNAKRNHDKRLENYAETLQAEQLRRDRNREGIRASARESARRSRASNPEKHRAACRATRAKHQAKYAASHKLYRQRRAEFIKQLHRDWLAKNPEHKRVSGARRRAQKANALSNDFTAKEWRALCKAMGYRCAYCGRKFTLKKLTQDHITPLSRGGSHTLANILPACLDCNLRKHTKDVPCPVQPFLLVDEGAAD
jgi:5-methylcytosine-specific restriction endonuclease McrA